MSLIVQPSTPSAPPLEEDPYGYNPSDAVEAMPVNGLQQDLDFIKQKLMELHGVAKKHDEFLVHIEKRVEQLERIVDRHTQEIYAGQGTDKFLTGMNGQRTDEIKALFEEINRIKAMLQEVTDKLMQEIEARQPSKKSKSWLRF